MAKHQSVTRQSQHKEGDDYGGIEAGASPLSTCTCTTAKWSGPFLLL